MLNLIPYIENDQVVLQILNFEYDLDIDERKVTKDVTSILKEGLLN